MRKNTCIFIASLLLLFASSYAYAQQKAYVHGVVKDTTGQPVQDVLIGIVGSTQLPTYTDSAGRFKYAIPAGVPLEVYFVHPGFISRKDKVNLKAGEDKELAIAIKPVAPLNAVNVTAQRHNSQEMTELNPKIVKFIPMPSGDFNAILATQPGVMTRSELGSEYSVRGGSYDENLVYVNGIEVYRPFLIREGEQEGLSFINPDMVSSVSFSAGGFEAKYGDKMSSVLDVTYKKPTHFEGSASGSLLGGTLHLEGVDKSHRFTWIMGVRYKSNQYLLKSLDVKGDYKPKFADAQLYMTYALTDRWELDILGNYALDVYDFVPQDETASFGTISQAYQLQVYFQGQEVDKFQTATGATSLQYRSDKLKLRFTASAFNSIENQDYDVEGDYLISQLTSNGQVGYAIGVGSYLNHARDDLNGLVYNFSHAGNYEYKPANNLLWGVTLQREQFTSVTSQWNLIDSAGYSLPYSPYILALNNVVKTYDTLVTDRIMGYAEDISHWQTADTNIITLTAGVRANYSDMNYQLVVSPRATLAYKPNWKKKDMLFRLSSGFYFQPPFYKETIDQYGNLHTDIKAQESIHFVGGMDWNLKLWNRPFKFVTEAYYKDLVNIIPYGINNVYVNYYPEQTAKGYVQGIDMKINGDFVKGLESWFSLSVLQAKYKVNNGYYYTYYNSYGQQIIPGVTANTVIADSVKNTIGYQPMPTDERVTASLFFQDYLPRFPNFKVHLNLIFGTGIPFGPPSKTIYGDTLRSPFYERVDLGCSYLLVGKKGKKDSVKKGLRRYFRSIWIGLDVFNLLQANNVISYNWISDVSGRQYAVPNYLTARELNLRLMIDF